MQGGTSRIFIAQIAQSLARYNEYILLRVTTTVHINNNGHFQYSPSASHLHMYTKRQSENVVEGGCRIYIPSPTSNNLHTFRKIAPPGNHAFSVIQNPFK